MPISAERAVQIQVATKAVMDALRGMEKRLPETMKKDAGVVGKFMLDRFIAARLLGKPGLNKRSGQLKRSFRVITKGKDLGDLELHFVTTAPYAKTHEFGATIVPKSAKMLAIPFPRKGKPSVLTPAGVYKLGKGRLKSTLPAAFGDYNFFVAGKLSTGKTTKKPKGQRGSRVRKAQKVPKVGKVAQGPPQEKKKRKPRARVAGGPLFLWGAKKGARPGTKAAIPVPFFILKDRVTIKPRLKFFKTIEGYMKVLWERLNTAAGKVVDGK